MLKALDVQECKTGSPKSCHPCMKKMENLPSVSSPLKSNIVLIFQDPVVQSVINLTSSLVVKMLTVLVNTIPNSQLFLLKKCE